jgi:hypothetical protein
MILGGALPAVLGETPEPSSLKDALMAIAENRDLIAAIASRIEAKLPAIIKDIAESIS